MKISTDLADLKTHYTMKNLIYRSGAKATGISVSIICIIALTVYGAIKIKELYMRRNKSTQINQQIDVVIQEDPVAENKCNSPKICK